MADTNCPQDVIGVQCPAPLVPPVELDIPGPPFLWDCPAFDEVIGCQCPEVETTSGIVVLDCGEDPYVDFAVETSTDENGCCTQSFDLEIGIPDCFGAQCIVDFDYDGPPDYTTDCNSYAINNTTDNVWFWSVRTHRWIEICNCGVQQYACLTFDSDNYTIDGFTGGDLTITVNRTLDSVGTVTVNYATVDGTAVAPTDYTSASGTLIMGDSVTSATFPVTVQSHGSMASDLSFTINLADPTGRAVICDPSVTTITMTAVPPISTACCVDPIPAILYAHLSNMGNASCVDGLVITLTYDPSISVLGWVGCATAVGGHLIWLYFSCGGIFSPGTFGIIGPIETTDDYVCNGAGPTGFQRRNAPSSISSGSMTCNSFSATFTGNSYADEIGGGCITAGATVGVVITAIP